MTKNFSESFFHVLNWWYFLYQRRPQCNPKKSFSGSSQTVIMDCCTKHLCKTVRWIHTSQRSFYESFILVFVWGYFLCHRKLHCIQKYPLADFQKTVLSHWTLKRKVLLFELHSHVTMQFLWRLLSFFHLRIFRFSPYPSMSSQISLCRTQDNRVSILFQEGKGGTLCDEVTHQKAISEKDSLYLLCEDNPFFTMGPYGLPNITLQITRKEC